jgi:hypothetical protein
MEEIIKNCKTISEAVRNTLGYDNGRTRKKFLFIVEEQNLDITHLRSKPLLYERVIKECPVCGKEFEDLVGHPRQKTTCSYSCSNTHFRSGENNPNYKEIKDVRSSNKYRRICFEQHKPECIICGENKIVSVHHYDENHENNSIENLIPLCPTHHQYVHSRYKNDVIDTINKYREEFISKNNLGT